MLLWVPLPYLLFHSSPSPTLKRKAHVIHHQFSTKFHRSGSEKKCAIQEYITPEAEFPGRKPREAGWEILKRAVTLHHLGLCSLPISLYFSQLRFRRERLSRGGAYKIIYLRFSYYVFFPWKSVLLIFSLFWQWKLPLPIRFMVGVFNKLNVLNP